MTYIPPTITAAGIDTSNAAYSDCRDDLLAIFQSIYGQNTYLGIDSAPYQMISAWSAKWADLLNLLKGVFNAQSPKGAIGVHLDQIQKLLGIARSLGSNSQAPALVTGTAGFTIPGGVVRDANGLLWDLPLNLQIGGGGTVNTVLTCEQNGPIAADVGTITAMVNPIAGWTSVSNTADANLGSPIESDSKFRARGTISVALPSLTMVASVKAAVAAVPGVTRYQVYENPTGATDSNGLPAHSLSVVTEGGDPAAIALAVYQKHGIGADTYGTTSVVVTDPTGGTFTLNFFEVAYTPIYVTANVKGFTGYSGTVLTQIQAAINAYLNSLQIGETVTLSGIIAAAMAFAGNISQPLFSLSNVLIGTAPSPTSGADIAITFNHVSQGMLANVVLTQL